MVRQHRISYPFDEHFIDEQINAGWEVIVQFAEASYNDKVLHHLNELCSRYDKNFAVRFYGHYSGSFDFNNLLKIPEVKNLYVDCLTKAENIKAIKELKKLDKLSLGVFELTETEILDSSNLRRLSELIITETRTKAFNLAYLQDFKNLKFLIVAGHNKNIDAIGELSSLEYLSFNSLKKTPVPFVNKLKNLKTLKFILGGRENILEIEENNIENLEIVWVRGFNDLSNISNFRNLKTLLVEDNIQLPSIDFDEELPHLEDLKIINCKTLSSLTGLERLPSLKQLRIYKTNLDFDKLIKQPLPKELKIFAFYTSKQKLDNEIKLVLEKKGYTDGLSRA
jgi:protein phosphatase 1 regulatory subunit 7